MDDKTERLEALRRVTERLRKITDDAFAANLAERLEAEIARQGDMATYDIAADSDLADLT